MQISLSHFAVWTLAGLLAGSLGVGALPLESAPTADTPVVEPQRDQIRMEQTVIVRVPRASSPPKGKGRDFQSSFKEEKMGGCVAMKKIAGVRVSGPQTLELLTVDGQLVRAYLGKGCDAREFHSGFYFEKPGDGKFCKDREVLHARSGAQCRVTKFRLLRAK